MQFFEDLPPGLWVVKWIDRLHLGHDAEAAKVDVALERLPLLRSEDLADLSPADIGELLGTKPREAWIPPRFVCRPILAGYIPAIHVGDLFDESGAQVGRLPWSRRAVRLTEDTPLLDVRVGSAIPAPSNWKVEAPFRVLNKFEFQLGGIAEVHQSRCLVFRDHGTEYVLPKMAIFQAFYAQSSRLINALCNGPWSLNAKDLISLSTYKSGISTEIDDASGAWRIVLQMGVPRDLACTLSLFWFDDYARRQAEALFTDSLMQNDGHRGGDGRRWFINANIPHRLAPHPFEMVVQGFPLRALWPSRPHEAPERFLITAVSSSSWSLPNQVIEFDWHNSNTQGEEQHEAEGDGRGYGGRRAQVVGDPGAVASSSSDPGADEPTNVFEAGTFEYLNAPLPTLQQKLSSVKLTQSAATSAQGASALVSAGDPSHASVVPAPADLQARMRARSQQFEFLVRALEELVATGVVQSFKPIPSASDNRLGVMRSGMPCWSLLKRRDRDRGRVPKRGWEVVDDGDLNSEAAKEGTRSSFKHGRVVLLLSVRIDDVDLALLEIEPRPTASAFRMIAFVQSQPLAPVLVIPALETIREHEGVFQDSDLDSAFSSMTANPVVALKHSYTFDASDQLKVPTGLRASILGRALQGIALSRTSP